MKRIFISLLFIVMFSYATLEAAQRNKIDVIWGPTPYKLMMKMFKMANVGKDDVLYDLGCGDGRIIVMAAKKFGTRGVGVDLDPIRIEQSKRNARWAKVTNRVIFLKQNIFDTDVSEATVVTLYLNRKVNLRLRPKLLRELKPGSRIVSHNWHMGKWSPDKSCRIGRRRLFFWIVPANVTGIWRWTMSDEVDSQYILRLNQKFQNVRGVVSKNSSRITIRDIKLRGNRIWFTIKNNLKFGSNYRFEGIVNNNTIEGSVKARKRREIVWIKRWTARRDPSTILSIDGSLASK